MVDFVMPHLLGTKAEFHREFVQPIMEGQHADSSEREVRQMKKKTCVLHRILLPLVQVLTYHLFMARIYISNQCFSD
jgi:transcriptional regulator ATRX